MEFGQHVPRDSLASMVTGIAVYGNVIESASGRQFEVMVFRPSNLPELKRELTKWELYGFLRWSIDVENSN